MSKLALESLDLISAIWIFSSNDENHLITYEGVRDRLGLDAAFDVRALVATRRELFRPGAPSSEFEEWKQDMRAGNRLPGWVKSFPVGAERESAINTLSRTDVFRSQFRPYRDSPKSDIAVLNWGLDHIDRIRKGKLAFADVNAKGWQMWLVFVASVANIIATIAIGLLSKMDIASIRQGQTTLTFPSSESAPPPAIAKLPLNAKTKQ
jgi:hypothetical protein